MAARTIIVEPFDLIVFGATGDLSRRKLIPGLYHREFAGQLPAEARIIGASRAAGTGESFRADCRKSIMDHVTKDEIDPVIIDRFLARIDYFSVDALSDEGWDALAATLKPHDDRVRVFYLAVSPDIFGDISRQISSHGLVTPHVRVVLEKPLGKSLETAKKLHDSIGAIFPEESIYRIDHYLGKETVQNLMALRFANSLFEPLWNGAHIDHVQITVAESLGVEGRAGYYDTAGALRDMVQNHLLQLLCLVAMETPVSLEADALRDEKLKVLKSLKPIDERTAPFVTVRGQYRAGASSGGAVPGYLDELGREISATETFVALKAEVENWRWAGTPFYLRTGKRLASRMSEIVLAFKPIPHSVFDRGAGPISQNQLVIRLQPDEGVKLWLMIKDPGPGGMRLQYVPLDMSFARAFGVRNVDAYERLIMDVVRGNQSLFMRRDEVEAAWSWIDPILESWRESKDMPKPYTAGTWGPSAAVALIERDGRTWHEDIA